MRTEDDLMEELTRRVDAINNSVIGNVEKITSLGARLLKTEQAIDEQHRILISIERLSNGVATVSTKVDDLSKKTDGLSAKVNGMELKPAKRWEAMIGSVLEIVIALVLGYMASKLGLL